MKINLSTIVFVNILFAFISCSPIVIPIAPNMPPNVSSYAEVKTSLDGGYTPVIYGRLYFLYKEEYNSNTLKYKVFNKQNQVVLTDASQPISITTGESRFNLNVSGIVNSTDYFILEITNVKNEKFYLRFK